MSYDEKDFGRLAFEVRRFLSKSDIMTHLTTLPVLYLEMPDVGTMHRLHKDIIAGMPPGWLMSPTMTPWTYPDDHTIKFEPYAGVTIVLSCKQRFAVQSGGSVGYRDIAFRSVDNISKKD